MDDLLLVLNFLDHLKKISLESTPQFESRGFKLRKWVANGSSKTVLSGIPKCDLGSKIREINLSAESVPDSKTLGLVWNVEIDRLRVCFKHQKLGEVTTRREILGALANQFDPSGILTPCLLERKMNYQKVTILGLGWDDELPEDILKDWSKWINVMWSFASLSITRYCFLEGTVIEDNENVAYQFHEFCDASSQALFCVVYLRCIIKGGSCVAFVQGNTKVVLVNQTNWFILHKELEVAEMCTKLIQDVSKSLQHLGCSLHFWSDSQVVLRWIINPHLHLPRFVKRRVEKILLVVSVDAWRYVNRSLNSADLGTRVVVKRSDNHSLWLSRPDFLMRRGMEPCNNNNLGNSHAIFPCRGSFFWFRNYLWYSPVYKPLLVYFIPKAIFIGGYFRYSPP